MTRRRMRCCRSCRIFTRERGSLSRAAATSAALEAHRQQCANSCDIAPTAPGIVKRDALNLVGSEVLAADIITSFLKPKHGGPKNMAPREQKSEKPPLVVVEDADDISSLWIDTGVKDALTETVTTVKLGKPKDYFRSASVPGYACKGRNRRRQNGRQPSRTKSLLSAPRCGAKSRKPNPRHWSRSSIGMVRFAYGR